jgi:hypothetical protein
LLSYGLLSTVIYASILGIATLPLPDHGEGEVDWRHLPAKEQHWHKRLSFRKQLVPAPQTNSQQDTGKGGYNTTVVEELLPKQDGYAPYGHYDAYGNGMNTSTEEMNRRRWNAGNEYQAAGTQSRY